MNEPLSTMEQTASRFEKLTQLEIDVIDIFVRFARFFGVSKSVGEIYGLLFISTAPVPLDYIRAKLNLSSGSASQGLRLLRNVGAVHATYVAGDRRDHYMAETGLRKITTGFLREKVVPDLMMNEEQMERLSTLLEGVPAGHRPTVAGRIDILQSWRRQARAVLPIVMSQLESGGQS
jgi:DNA-binding transcriptional regulator GbsR (MarR family)